MKAIDAENRRSIVSDTLQSLGKQARAWRAKIDLLEAGQQLDRAEAVAELGKLLDLSQNLRDAILSEDSGATWTSKSELDSLVTRLDDVAAKRRRYLDLAQRLQAGTVTHRRERTKVERLRLRDAAVAELMETSGQTAAPELPGPGVAEWLEWACSLDDSTNDPDLQTLNKHFPRVDDFIRQLEIELWHDGAETAALNSAAGKPSDETSAGDNGSSGAGGLRIEEAETDGKNPADAYAEAAAARLDEPIAAIATAEAPAATEDEVAPARTARPKGADGASFFAADEVDCLGLYLDKARNEPKSARKVRALVGISHWLTPADQNPALHLKCGLPMQIGYATKRTLPAVSPVEAEKIVAADSGLPLVIGGADLLRWSLEHGTEGRFDAIASLRRLTIGQLKAWFGDVFKIELAEPQVLDMFRLTYGIPLLVGELHRRIIPMHDNPPSWLGFAIWTRVKQSFDAQIPVLAQELKDGPEAVRLTEREIALLKMVVIASEDSTPDTLVSNLMEGWHKYRRPELQPLNSADETSVQVLESLGLLPMRTEWASRPLKALMPVEIDDPIRQLVSYL